MSNLLEIKNLSAAYGESKVIQDLSFEVPKDNIVCLIGRNGVGKSTTLKSIMGLVKTPSGKIIFDDNDILKLPSYERVKMGIGYVPQGRDIFPRMTVQENLELGLEAADGKSRKIPEYIYELFPILPQFAKRKGGDLSGGQQQQLAIARALVSEPKLLVLDEPTEGIQPSIIKDIGKAIRRVNKEFGITVLIVEQFLEFVMGISDYLYVLEKGEVILQGNTEKLSREDVQKRMT
ncbi:MAG: urea ABC transporter ATP-binding subunit UrtE [Ruminococcus sp.]|jgi:urea transport system ATP-binding protein|nr:urea ABC transporter ATP-binding subunit UrtE [Ruminococcus sp.]